jgi:hypothetical protein
MIEEFYQLYKSMRDMVADLNEHNLSDPFREMVRSTRINCERYDRANKDCLNRWLKERQDGR